MPSCFFHPVLNIGGAGYEVADMLEDGGCGLSTGFPWTTRDQFGLDRQKNGFDYRATAANHIGHTHPHTYGPENSLDLIEALLMFGKV